MLKRISEELTQTTYKPKGLVKEEDRNSILKLKKGEIIGEYKDTYKDGMSLYNAIKAFLIKEKVLPKYNIGTRTRLDNGRKQILVFVKKMI